jgi:hypothetical protein
LATGLDPERYRPLVVLPDHGELAGDLRGAGVEVLVRPLAVLRRALLSPAGLRAVSARFAADAGGLARLARARGVAVVHSNTSVVLGGAAAARLAGARHVWHVREIYAGFDRWFPAYRRLLLTADALPCVSEAARAQLSPARAADVLHDGLALQPAPRDRARSRAALGLPAESFVCAVLGRISAWKGQDVLARALADPALREIASADSDGLRSFDRRTASLLLEHRGARPIVFVSHRPNIELLTLELVEEGELVVGKVTDRGEIEVLGKMRLWK